MNKKALSERDICTKFITPALRTAGWDEITQIREEVGFTKGQIVVRGKLVTRGKGKRADYVLYYKPNLPIALIEAKDNTHSVGDGIQQALEYAETLNIPYVFSSNGDGFVFHDRTGASAEKESTFGLDLFPSPQALWEQYRQWKGLTPEAEELVLQDYYEDGSGKAPRYYQVNAVNAAIEALAKGRQRALLVMATGTGKTYTAFQIIWRLWKAKRAKRILFLADRNVLIDQTMVNDFRPFGGVMAKLSTRSKTIERSDGAAVDLTLAMDRKRRIDPSYEVYLGLGLHLGLRQRNLRELLVCPRDRPHTLDRQLAQARRGELRWNSRDGAWEVYIPAMAFKNAHSSFFSGRPFRLNLPDLGDLYAYIDAWIGRHRAALLGRARDTGTFFVKTMKVSSANAAYDQNSFYEAWRLTIQRYGIFNPYTGRGAIRGLLPHGPHNVRDVLATHILKQTGSYEQASYAIQDTPDMVAKHYGRFLPQDKAALAAQVLNQVWAA